MDKQMEQEQVEQTTQVNEEVQPTKVEEKPKGGRTDSRSISLHKKGQ